MSEWAEMTSGWFYLVLAGVAEIAWAVGLKYTHGFTRPLPSLITVLFMIISFALLSVALKTIPLGTAYASWTGIGAVGTAVLGMILFEESRSPLRLACIALIVVGLVGLKLVDGVRPTPSPGGGSHEEEHQPPADTHGDQTR